MTYEDLLMLSDDQNLIVREKDIPGFGGRIYQNRIAINKNLPTQKEKACVLAEELGHYHTTAGCILDQSDASNRKQEYRARLWGYNHQIGLLGLISAAKAGCHNAYEISEYLDVTEDYLLEALQAYRNKYGTGTMVDNYWITFTPTLQVYEMWVVDKN